MFFITYLLLAMYTWPILLALLAFAWADQRSDDEIKALPGLDFDINFKHFSGFLQASETHFLHYWFVESQGSVEKDPLIFWFNGGPGCSSLDGLLNEMGPYEVHEDGSNLKQNPFAWNKVSSILRILLVKKLIEIFYRSEKYLAVKIMLSKQKNITGRKKFTG